MCIVTWIIKPFTTLTIVHNNTIIYFGISITSWKWTSTDPELIIKCGLVIYPSPVTSNYINNTQPVGMF